MYHKYDEIKNEIKPFDLIFFQGKGFGADIIRYGEWLTSINRDTNVDSFNFSHVGIILTSDLLINIKGVIKGELYIWESTMKNRKSIAVPNVSGVYAAGVQLRNLKDVIFNYNTYYINKTGKQDKCETCMSIAYLNSNYRNYVNDNYDNIKNNFIKNIYPKYQNIQYDSQPLNLLSSVLPILRIELNSYINKKLKSKDWLFCSELVASVYKDINIFPNTCIPDYVVPTDFLNHDSDKIESGGIPYVLDKIIPLSIINT
jgi:hypothetical protein